MKPDDIPEVAALHAKMLKKKLWVVITRAAAPMDEIMPHFPAHLKYQIRLEKEGYLFGAGPLSEPSGTPTGTGMILLRAVDEQEARRLADNDPMHSSGVRAYTLQQWSLNEGRITVTLDFSDQTYSIV